VTVRDGMKRRIHIFYSGKVQGVGFRMTAEETAQEFGVVGWVKNLRNGQVELVAEGEQTVLERFLEALRQGSMKNFISQVDVTWSNASETFDEFSIRYY